jgi:GT2 family glycosyltransferase
LDQDSIEEGTLEYLEHLRDTSELDIIVRKHNKNIPLNTVWNSYVSLSVKPYVCLLNNDIRIPPNFLQDVVDIFEKEPTVGAIMHPTNHPSYKKMLPELKYEILERGKYRQGWDICIRKEAWTPIPQFLTIYCGDDFVFENMYKKGYDYAVAISSPIVHYLGQTRKSKYNLELPERNPKKDIANYRSLGYVHHMVPPEDYTIVDFTQSPVDFIEE